MEEGFVWGERVGNNNLSKKVARRRTNHGWLKYMKGIPDEIVKEVIIYKMSTHQTQKKKPKKWLKLGGSCVTGKLKSFSTDWETAN